MSEEERKNFSSILIEAIKMKSTSVEKLSQATGVPENVIGLLINEKFDKLPAAPYLHGYLLKISGALNLDGEKVWKEYLSTKDEIRKSGAEDILPPNRFAIPKVNKKIVGVIIGIVLILMYAAFRLPSIVGTPFISFTDMPNNITVTKDQNFAIQGILKNGDTLSMNGEGLPIDKNGDFQKTVVLNPGFNTFKFEATKILGKTYSTTKQVYFQFEGSSSEAFSTSTLIHPAATSTNQ
jgi:cytoskeletal protein RodZ